MMVMVGEAYDGTLTMNEVNTRRGVRAVYIWPARFFIFFNKMYQNLIKLMHSICPLSSQGLMHSICPSSSQGLQVNLLEEFSRPIQDEAPSLMARRESTTSLSYVPIERLLQQNDFES